MDLIFCHILLAQGCVEHWGAVYCRAESTHKAHQALHG